MTVVLGTGLGIAFFLFVAERRANVSDMGANARTVVLADLVFTAPAVDLQPITGVALAYHQGYDPFGEVWIVASFWVPRCEVAFHELTVDQHENKNPKQGANQLAVEINRPAGDQRNV